MRMLPPVGSMSCTQSVAPTHPADIAASMPRMKSSSSTVQTRLRLREGRPSPSATRPRALAKASMAQASPPFMSQDPRPYSCPSRTTPEKAPVSAGQPSPATTVSMWASRQMPPAPSSWSGMRSLRQRRPGSASSSSSKTRPSCSLASPETARCFASSSCAASQSRTKDSTSPSHAPGSLLSMRTSACVRTAASLSGPASRSFMETSPMGPGVGYSFGWPLASSM